MHGKKRSEYKARLKDPKTAAVLEKKAEQWYILMKELQDRRTSSRRRQQCQRQQQRQRQQQEQGLLPETVVVDDDTDTDTDTDTDINVNIVTSTSESDSSIATATATATTLKLLEKALMVNPDPTNLWNHRREVIIEQLNQQQQQQQQQKSSLSSGEKIKGTDKEDDTDKDLKSSSSSSSSLLLLLLDQERGLTQAALQRNPKAYGAWYHRKWIIQYIKPTKVVLEEELQLTATFLLADERNFHCWNYRRFIIGCLAGSWNGQWMTIINIDTSTKVTSTTLMGPQVVIVLKEEEEEQEEQEENHQVLIPKDLIKSEFDFTTSKIQQNFSNFSAFHYRSQLLDHYYLSTNTNDDDIDNEEIMDQTIEEEFQLIENGICTEPDDQTCWWYHAILLDKLTTTPTTNVVNNNINNNNVPLLLSGLVRQRLEEQANLFHELLEDSPESKWVTLGLFRVLQLLSSSSGEDGNINADTSTNTSSSKEERENLLQRLMKIDSDRSQRYEEMLRQIK